MPSNYYQPSPNPFTSPTAAPQAWPGQQTGYPRQAMQRPFNNVIRVSGEQGADSFFLPPDSAAIMVDTSEPIMYYKTTDSMGRPDLRIFPFTEAVKQEQDASVNYVTREELANLSSKVDNLMKELGVSNAKPDVQQPTATPESANEPSAANLGNAWRQPGTGSAEHVPV